MSAGMPLLQDLTASVRSLRRDRSFTIAALATLTLGSGAAGGLLGVVDSVLLRPLPYAEPARIHAVWFVTPTLPGALDRVRHSEGTYLHWRDRSEAFEAFGLAERYTSTLDDGEDVTRVAAARVTDDMHRVLGREVAVGRSLVRGDMAPGAEPVVLLTDAEWAERFGRSDTALGRLVVLDGVARRVVGVLPPEVRFPTEDVRLWVPMTIDEGSPGALNFLYTGYGRLAPAQDLASAEADFMRLVDRLPEVMPAAFPRPLLERAQFRPRIEALPDVVLGETATVLALLGAAVLVLLGIVATNFTGLALARTDRRTRDLAVRAATGATNGRLRRLILLDALVLSLSGAILGLLLAGPLVRSFVASSGELLPRTVGVGLTVRASLTTVAAALVIGIAAGWTCVLRREAIGAEGALRSGARGSAGGRSSTRLRQGLVALQVAMAVALVFDAGLLVRSFQRLLNVDPGFDDRGVVSAALSLDGRSHPGWTEGESFLLAFLDDVAALPGVEAAALSNHVPLREGRIFRPFVAEDVPSTAELPQPQLTRAVTDGYFDALGVEILDGRPLDRDDLLPDRTSILVSLSLAEAWWPGRSALGRRVRYGLDEQSGTPDWLEVVGVVADVRDRRIDEPAPGIVYVPWQLRHLPDGRWREVFVSARSSRPVSVASSIRALLSERDRSVPLYDVRSIERVLADVSHRDRAVMLLLTATALVALALASVGLYGALSFAVGQRRHEIGLRLALGAEPGRVRDMVLRQAGSVIGLGLVGGAVAAALTHGVVTHALFETAPADPVAVGLTLLLLLGVSAAATYGPAHRASLVSPTLSLQEN